VCEALFIVCLWNRRGREGQEASFMVLEYTFL
jgi:hypothetical protein